MKKIISFIIGLLLVTAVTYGIGWIIIQIWKGLKLLDTQVSISILTASATIIGATLTVVIGKYYERIKDIEAHYRVKKTEIYDEFLREFFKLFHSDESSDDLVVFFREWQRKIILWGGQGVLSKYIEWMSYIKNGNNDAKTLFLIEDFFIEIRKDLGHKNNKLIKGTFIHLILKNPELFLSIEKNNPNITLSEFAEIEKTLTQ